MTKIQLHGHWVSDESIREGFSKLTKGNYKWNDIELVSDGSYDYFIVINYPSHDNFDKKKTIVFQNEPIFTRKGWKKYHNINKEDFLYVFDIPSHHSYVGWSLKRTYTELSNCHPKKTKIMSGVVSGLQMFPGQKDRVKFIRRLDSLDFYDHYGRDVSSVLSGLKRYKGSIQKKEEGLFPYKYTFAGENSYENNYFTEKLTDAILSECLCFYSGCPNISKFIDEKSYVKIDLQNPEKAYRTVLDCIENGEWEKRIEYIRSAKEKILNKLQIFPVIEGIMKENI